MLYPNIYRISLEGACTPYVNAHAGRTQTLHLTFAPLRRVNFVVKSQT